MDTSNLAKRMKEYESVNKIHLTKRMPVLLRFDGCHFKTFTRRFIKPEQILIKTMQETAKYLCENIQNAVFAYTQSDEITVLLVDYYDIGVSTWFNNKRSKMESVGASMCTMAFNKFFRKNVEEFVEKNYDPENKSIVEYIDILNKAIDEGAMFDCRAFNIPKDEVTNNFFWRQSDASRNSILMFGKKYFGHSGTYNKTCNEIQDMLILKKGINWNDYPTEQKRGSCVIKSNDTEQIRTDNVNEFGDIIGSKILVRRKWIVDKEIPIFKGDGREYIERFVNLEKKI